MTARGLIFDVDGVIADTESVNAAASARVFRDLFGLTVARGDFAAGLGRGAAAYVRAAAEVHGRDLTPAELAEAVARRQRYFLADLVAAPLPAFPGVRELMDEALAAPDFGVAIATSSTREKSEAVLRSAGVPYDRMPYITGSDVSHKKPDPELFLSAAAGLGMSPAVCVVVEDAPNGVAAAAAAGCRCIAVTNSVTAAELADADHVVDSLAAVSLDTVRALVGGVRR
jgi:HAD superfamily hydrolase (TIGR01509 family)